MKKLWFWWMICECGLLLFLWFSLPYNMVRNWDINELLQDWSFQHIPLARVTPLVLKGELNAEDSMLEILPHQSTSGVLWWHIPSADGLIAMIMEGRGAQERQGVNANRFFFSWNDDMGAYWPQGALRQMFLTQFHFALIFFDLLLVLLGAVVFYYWRKGDCEKVDCVRCASWMIVIGSIVLGVGVFYFPGWVNYERSHRSIELLLHKNLTPLSKLLNTADGVGIYSLDFLPETLEGEKNDLYSLPLYPWWRTTAQITDQKVFVSKTPFFPYNYIRINVNPLTYLFFAPNLTFSDMQCVNDKMNFTNLGHGIWLGQYQVFIGQIERFRIIWCASLLLWSVAVGCSVGFLLRYRDLFPEKNI